LNTNKLYSRVNTDQYKPGQAPGPIGPKPGPITASTIHHPNRRHQPDHLLKNMNGELQLLKKMNAG
jgi:hypothetical protein